MLRFYVRTTRINPEETRDSLIINKVKWNGTLIRAEDMVDLLDDIMSRESLGGKVIEGKRESGVMKQLSRLADFQQS